MTLREKTEQRELLTLSPNAAFAAYSKGRKFKEEEDAVRTCFQRDIDRIVHSKAFRRLKQKTQVFLEPEGDHYRTRLTHTLEVIRIARTISRGLGLNEDLTEAAAIGHDLGHTPFGHAGERALSSVMAGGFRHNEQSVRVIDKLEKDGKGLNLSWEVRNGILCHTTSSPIAETEEGRVIQIADQIAYINHDIDDAIRGGIISADDIPKDIEFVLGDTKTKRINSLVLDVIDTSLENGTVLQSDLFAGNMKALKEFMFENVYTNPIAKGEEGKAQTMILQLFDHYCSHPEELPDEYQNICEEEGIERAACDYIAGMTDTFAVSVYSQLYIPKAWTIR